MKRFILAIFFLLSLCISGLATAADLHGGYVGRVLNNTPGTWQTYSFSFTPSVAGSNYIMLAFRQDPAYWRVDNISLKAAGSSAELLTNGNMNTGGSLTVQTNNGQQYINAPTAWGVAYQNGTYPAAAGTWMNGLWYDGAVGSYDSIYQAVTLTAGVTYVISFQVNGDHMSTPSTLGWQLGVYAGPCGSTSLSPTECSLPGNSGFTQIATPGQTYTAGCTNNCPAPPPPPAPEYCCGGSSASFNANSDFTNRVVNYTNNGVGLTVRTSGGIGGVGSAVLIEQIGSSNSTSVTQSGTDKNYIKYYANGNNNSLTSSQTSTTTTSTNYVEFSLTGSNNTTNLVQQSTGGTKGMMASVTGSSDNVTIQQKDNGNHYAEITLSGGNKTVNLLQEGSAAQMANINLSGGATSITTTQSGATQQFYSITYNCATPSCAAITVTQGTR
jgi:hypothetical protein